MSYILGNKFPPDLSHEIVHLKSFLNCNGGKDHSGCTKMLKTGYLTKSFVEKKLCWKRYNIGMWMPEKYNTKKRQNWPLAKVVKLITTEDTEIWTVKL